MSSHARRRLLREWRRLAVYADYVAHDWEIPKYLRTVADWNRWERDSFRAIRREPLRFPNNIRPDSGLINIQARNRPNTFNLLDGSFPPDCSDSPIWSELSENFEAAEQVFYDALARLEPLKKVCRPRFDWASWANRAFNDGLLCRPTGKPDPALFMLESHEGHAEYIARLQRAARALRGTGHCLHQHASAYGPIHAARTCIRKLDARLTDTQILCLMVMFKAMSAGESMLELAHAMQEETTAAGIDPEDDQAIYRLRGRIAAWERGETRYYTGQLESAREWLALVEKLVEKEEADTRERRARDELEATKKAAAADSHKSTSAKGGRNPKGSKGLRKLAESLRNERPNSSDQKRFDLALARCNADGEIKIEGYTMTANPDGKILSTGPDGQPDGRPVGFAGWRKLLAT